MTRGGGSGNGDRKLPESRAAGPSSVRAGVITIAGRESRIPVPLLPVSGAGAGPSPKDGDDDDDDDPEGGAPKGEFNGDRVSDRGRLPEVAFGDGSVGPTAAVSVGERPSGGSGGSGANCGPGVGLLANVAGGTALGVGAGL